MKKEERKIMAQVCDKLAIVTKNLAKDCKTKSQKRYMDKEAQGFKNLAKVFRSLNNEKEQ